MKKRVLAFVGAVVLTCAMSLSAFAAESNTATNVAEQSTKTVTTAAQTITATDVAAYAATTTVTSAEVPGATVAPVNIDVAEAAVVYAESVTGNSNISVATVVDLVVPAGTGAATFTLACPVLAGQDVTIVHMKSDLSWESIKPVSVDNGSVTFTMTSYSPVAVIVNATAPKTQDIILMVAGLAVVCLAGAVVFGRKARA